jgi:hypothetical protein
VGVDGVSTKDEVLALGSLLLLLLLLFRLLLLMLVMVAWVRVDALRGAGGRMSVG